jgi:hypothetical protein
VKRLVTKVGFTQSKVDECVFYRGKAMYLLYTDDSILAGPDQRELDMIVQEMKEAGLAITVEGDIQDFLGVNVERRKDGMIKLSQPHLINQILKDLRLDDENVVSKKTPAASSQILRKHADSRDFDKSFDYRSVIGKMNYLEKGSRSDIAYAVHQCARFSAFPKMEHGKAIRWIARYLHGTRDEGTIFKPKRGLGLEVYVDADFAGNWDAEDTASRDTARSRHGYFIMYGGCPVVWKSQLQGEICLSTTESEYTGLSYALRQAIPIIELLKEMKGRGYPVTDSTPTVRCKVFEDNSGALVMATDHKSRPRTRHINVRMHHFRDYVERGEISIHPIGTDSQLADFLTKPVNQQILERLRLEVMGW